MLSEAEYRTSMTFASALFFLAPEVAAPVAASSPVNNSTIQNIASSAPRGVAQTLRIARYSSICAPCEALNRQHSEQPTFSPGC